MGVSVGHQIEFSREIYNWTLTRECGRGFDSEKPNGTRIGDLGGDYIRKFNGCECGGVIWGFPGRFPFGPQQGDVGGVFGRKFLTGP